MNKRTERLIQKIYNTVFNKIYSKSTVGALSRGDRKALLKAVTILNSSKEYNDFAVKYAKELSKKGIAYKKGEWRKYFNAAKKLGYIGLEKTWTEFENDQMNNVIKQNFELIKSIPKKSLEIMEHKYTTTLIEEVAKGSKTRGSFYRELKSHGAKNAKVIARTEAAKLQTTLTENRAVDLGSVAYEWVSSRDKRTRPSHKAMNGVIVFWRKNDSEKPELDKMTGHAGEFPNCRCSPNPIFDEDDLIKSNYKVYNYKTHKIINMTKKELINALEKGSL